ncbi:MAG: DUF4493 domain-containing protein [Bacteroidales bacterium]|nr:DUF4493 domain-containing protein [Bacteroidales bacterium]
MKKILFVISTALMMFASCQKTPVSMPEAQGVLSFSSFELSIDETLETKATEASGTYTITILDAEGKTHLTQIYSEIKNNGNKISLPAGDYTLVASSYDEEVPFVHDEAIYGTSEEFTIVAGEETEIGALICTLLQCKVTVEYSDEFLEHVTGAGKATVTLRAGYPYEYALGADKRYDKNPAYFAVDGTTLTVVFQGSIDGKNMKMTKQITGIAPAQWRQIKFIQKKNEQGNATFDIVINDFVSDAILNEDAVADAEVVIGEDPDAPKGDGGIALEFNYADGCDEELTDLNNMLIVPESERQMSIKLKAIVPNGILKFSVEVQSSSSAFNNALAAAGGSIIDLINPSEANEVIFGVVPFPHGVELVGQTEVPFDLSAAQEAITNYPGTHTFLMTIVDQTFCTNKIPVTMIVE